MLSVLSQQLNSMMETRIQSIIDRSNPSYVASNLTGRASSATNSQNNGNSPPFDHVAPLENQTLEQLLGLNNSTSSQLPTGQANRPLNGFRNEVSNFYDLRPEKVGYTIHNWRIKFSGDSKGMSVENFLYRVEALTRQTLNGNFSLLCDHISMLFESKASCWFWRYHKMTRVIVWPDLCSALRRQFKDSRTDVDLREIIRDRKQKLNENFDDFYDAIVEVSDRLTDPLDDKVLIEILRRNFLPEIQHEILNIHIESVSKLRDICRRREFFLQNIGRKHLYTTSVVQRKQVNEIVEEEENPPSQEEISAIVLTCWNCEGTGHRWHDCLEERRVFCYGCGQPNVFNPKCVKCKQKNFQPSALNSARKPLSPISPITSLD